jgi:hypothetical protein
MKLIQEKIILASGIFLLILPFTGFPRSWKSVLSACVGVLIIYVGALLYKKSAIRVSSEKSETKTKAFTESV